MPVIEVPDADSCEVEFTEPDPGPAGFHTISMDPPIINPIPPMLSMPTLALPVEPAPQALITPPPTRRSWRVHKVGGGAK